MTGRHLTDPVLGLYALQPTLVRNHAGVEAHLADCHDCRTALEAIRTFDAALADGDTWPSVSADAGDSAAVEQLRAFAVRSAEEDRDALLLLAEYEDLNAAPRFAWADIPNKPKYRTGGIARLLCKRANGMCIRKPLHALVLAETATRISASLPDATYPRATIHELRGEAWKEQANALYTLGRFDDALTALDYAEAEYLQLPHEGIGLVAVRYVRASVFSEQEKFDAADELARESAHAAFHLGATDRCMRAQRLQGEIRIRRGDIAAAIELFASVLQYGRAQNDEVWIARESIALGVCYVMLGNACEASQHLSTALRLFTKLQFPSEVIRTNWAISRLIFLQGNTAEAIRRLRDAISALTSEGMVSDAAIASIHLAEMLDATDRQREIPTLLAAAVHTFVVSGKRGEAVAALIKGEVSVSPSFASTNPGRQFAGVSLATTLEPISTKRLVRSRDADQRRLERAADLYLHACYGVKTAARTEEFATFIRIARPYLSRLVPELIGMPLREFLRGQQLTHAQHLLRTMPLTVDQIALVSAFGTPFTFQRCFKAAFGVTPGQYRLTYSPSLLDTTAPTQ
jgi:AraC-like DNA-binding protein